MPRIFDNIEQELLAALRQTLGLSQRSDFCVGCRLSRDTEIVEE
jgi:hypothetical protein